MLYILLTMMVQTVMMPPVMLEKQFVVVFIFSGPTNAVLAREVR